MLIVGARRQFSLLVQSERSDVTLGHIETTTVLLCANSKCIYPVSRISQFENYWCSLHRRTPHENMLKNVFRQLHGNGDNRPSCPW